MTLRPEPLPAGLLPPLVQYRGAILDLSPECRDVVFCQVCEVLNSQRCASFPWMLVRGPRRRQTYLPGGDIPEVPLIPNDSTLYCPLSIACPDPDRESTFASHICSVVYISYSIGHQIGVNIIAFSSVLATPLEPRPRRPLDTTYIQLKGSEKSRFRKGSD